MKKRTEPIIHRTVMRITAATDSDKRHTPAGHQTEGLDSTQNLSDIESGTSQMQKQFMKDYRRQSAARRS